MDPAVGHSGPLGPGDSPEQALDKDVEGIGAQIGLEKQCHAQVGDPQPDEQQHHPHRHFPKGSAFHGSSSDGTSFFSCRAFRSLK